MENAEEHTFLEQGEGSAPIDAALEKAFPQLQKHHSRYSEVATWREMIEEMPLEEGDFVFKAPFTREQASAFYRHLCQTDARRRNAKRTDDKPSIPRRCVYEIVLAAYELYDDRANQRGALQDVPPPTSPAQKLRVCGDTHGQLQDVRLEEENAS